MKIKVWSDLHLEFGRGIYGLFENWIPCDVFVLAGDISGGEYLEQWLVKLFRSIPKETTVLYVPGNHEYYKRTFSETNALLSDICERFNNIHYLNRKTITIDGVVFAGCVGWADGSGGDIYSIDFISSSISDFNLIKGFTPKKVIREGCLDRDFLNKNEANIYITHNGCSSKSIAAKYKESSLNVYFVNNYEDIISYHCPNFWFHGHTHSCLDYMLEDTRVVCNALGYPYERTGFMKDSCVNYCKDRFNLKELFDSKNKEK